MINYGGIDLPDPEDTGEIVLEACVLMKVIDKNGGVKYREWKSARLHPIEALGMITTFSDTLRQLIMSGVRPAGPPGTNDA